MANALERRLDQLERLVTRREDPAAAEERRRQAIAEAEVAFDAVERPRADLRARHVAAAADIRAALVAVRKHLAELRAIEQADYEPYLVQASACQARANRNRRAALGGSFAIADALDTLERLVRETEASR